MAQKIKGLMRVLLDLFFGIVLIACVLAAAVVVTSDGCRFHSMRMFGVVRSSSMKKSGLEIGDIVAISRQDDYEIGDTILFFRKPTSYNDYASKADLTNTAVWVHNIIDVKYDKLGRKTFLTQGTSNATHDFFYVPQDFVLGEARPLPPILNAIFKFIISPGGIYSLIVAPSGILFLLFSLDLFYLVTEQDDEDEQEPVRRGNMRRRKVKFESARGKSVRKNPVRVIQKTNPPYTPIRQPLQMPNVEAAQPPILPNMPVQTLTRGAVVMERDVVSTPSMPPVPPAPFFALTTGDNGSAKICQPMPFATVQCMTPQGVQERTLTWEFVQTENGWTPCYVITVNGQKMYFSPYSGT